MPVDGRWVSCVLMPNTMTLRDLLDRLQELPSSALGKPLTVHAKGGAFPLRGVKVQGAYVVLDAEEPGPPTRMPGNGDRPGRN